MLKKVKNFIKTFPYIYKILLPSYRKIVHIKRGLEVFLMIGLINVFPKIIYKFSKRKVLPNPKIRKKLEDLNFPPYEIIKDKSSDIDKMDEIHIFSSGCKDFNILKKINEPIFLLSLWDTLKVDENENILYAPEWHPIYHSNNPKQKEQSIKNLKEYKNDKITYVHNISTALDRILKKGNKVLPIVHHLKKPDGKIFCTSNEFYPTPIKINAKIYGVPRLKKYDNYEKFLNDNKLQRIFITENIYEPSYIEPPYSERFVPTGSFLTYLSILFFYAKKINIYGWNFYLDSSPKNISSYQLLKNMYNLKNDIKYSNALFETGIVNLYFAYRYSLMPNVKIFGYLGELQNHKKLLSNIEKVLFDN